MTEGAGALPLTTYIGRGPNAPRVWYMLKCICTLSLDPRLLQAHDHFNTPPHFVRSPSPAAKCLTLAEGKALVSSSATMSSVGQYMRHREPCSMTQRIKW